MDMLILFGSQTGSAEEVAERVARDASRRNFAKVKVEAMDSYDRLNLVNEKLVVFVAATTGDGDPPDNMKQFWRFLLRKELPKDVLSGLKIAVFGLGDSSYVKYNFVGKKLRNRLLQLGAQEISPFGMGDDQSLHGLEGDLDAWLAKTFWPKVLEAYPLPDGFVVDDSPKLFHPKHDVLQVSSEPPSTTDPDSELETFERVVTPFRPVGCYETGPLRARIVVNERITEADWEQDVRHVEIHVAPGTCPPYVAGDIAVVYPRNRLDEKQFVKFCSCIGVDPDGWISDLHLPHVPANVSVRKLFTQYLDLLGTPRRRFFEALSFFTEDEEEKEKLVEMCSAEGNDLFHTYCKKERKSYLEVFDDFKTIRPPLKYVVEMIPRLEPREYSIASARKVHGENVIHLSVAILSFLTPWGRRKTGVASSWLEHLDASQSPQVTLFVKKGVLKVPHHAPQAPMVLIGPGTGVAPMRSIIYERGNNSTHLYFGCRSSSKDFYYKQEWQVLLASSKLGSLRTAFSRDQKKKIYVQHLIKEDQELLYKYLVLEEGYCYISGSAKRMPSEVREALVEALAAHPDTPSKEQADLFVRRMEQLGRFKIESWS